jgi:hydroxymethylglutaryl-CoA synthase
VDGKRSVQVYLARMREAVEDFESVWGEVGPETFTLVPFHTPFPGMVRKAALLGFRHMIRDTGVEEQLAQDIGRQPRPEAFDDEKAFRDSIREYTDKLKQTDTYAGWYDDVIEPTLTISREAGNWYTGSVHVARISGLKVALDAGADMTGERLLVGSYGSGAQAEIHAETVQPGWEDEIEQLSIDEQLGRRYPLSFEEYEHIHDVHNHDKERQADAEEFTTPDAEFVFDGWGRMGERKYRYVE